jgi:hypothetical protein
MNLAIVIGSFSAQQSRWPVGAVPLADRRSSATGKLAQGEICG